MVSSSREGANGCGVQDEKIVSPVQRDKTEVVREWEVHIANSCSRNARIVAYGHFHVFGPEDSSGFGDSRVEVEARTGDLEGSLRTGLSIRNFDLVFARRDLVKGGKTTRDSGGGHIGEIHGKSGRYSTRSGSIIEALGFDSEGLGDFAHNFGESKDNVFRDVGDGQFCTAIDEWASDEAELGPIDVRSAWDDGEGLSNSVTCGGSHGIYEREPARERGGVGYKVVEGAEIAVRG